MEKERFLSALQEELTRQGLPPEDAARHTWSISLTLTEEDVAEIEKMEDPHDIAVLAAGIMSVKTRGTIREASAPPEIVKSGDTVSAPAFFASTETDSVSSEIAHSADDGDDADESIYNAILNAEAPEATATPPSRRGRTIFWLLFFLTLPLTAAFVICYFTLFGAVFALICAAIVLLVSIPIVTLAVGGTLALTGIIFGILQLLTEVSMAPGLFEIGLGLSIGGFVLLCGILIYNGIVRLIPLLIRLMNVTFRFSIRKIKELYHKAKEACYAL